MNERPPRIEREEELVVQVIACKTEPELVGAYLSARTLDVSATGMKLVLYVPLPEGTRLTVEVKNADHLQIEGEVRWFEAGDIIKAGVMLDELSDSITTWQSIWARSPEAETP
ncbi:MAG: PilZ domain-containing protein [Pseudomonadales bacterium]|nr:PilZ domain-containing protein [Pseudomonadales bacterium]